MQTFSNIKRTGFLIVLLSACCLSGKLKAQLSFKVLFLGNSYTYVNNLPQLVHDVALSAGDTLVFDSYAQGGYQLIDHCIDPTSQNKIMAGGWDYVVIQGQSQEPIIYTGSFNSGGNGLHNLVKQYNPCAVTMPYMTWGRKNGDASNCINFPVMCTYEGMDTTLRNRYLNLTSALNGEVSPVSVVWNNIRQNYPNLELYQPDESHPSLAGSYAAACCFYAAIFKKDPTLITFNPGLDTTDASVIRSAAKTAVFNNLQAWDFKKLPVSDFGYQAGSVANEIIFYAQSHGVWQTYLWDFGDGDTSSLQSPAHTYLADGTYTVTLTTSTCNLQGPNTAFSDTVIQLCSHTPTIYTSNPWMCRYDTLWTQAADAYQWFNYGNPLPETNQYLANYIQYNISGFEVLSTVNGCAELSSIFTDSAPWSGYYFDAMGDPCAGDTVHFAVLHINGFLSGAENILWYKNDTLLPLMTNEDTLLITSSGKYECKVVDPNAVCYLDSTSYGITYNCGVTGMVEYDQEILQLVFPNPASELISIRFSKYPIHEPLQIYNAMGSLVRSIMPSAATMQLHVADLARGIYYIRLKNSGQAPLKFIKL